MDSGQTFSISFNTPELSPATSFGRMVENNNGQKRQIKN